MGVMGRIDQRLLLAPKAVCFTTSVVYYLFHVFRMAFYTGYFDFDERQAGAVQACLSVGALAGVGLWSSRADASGLHSRYTNGVMCGMLVAFLAALLKYAIPQAWWFALACTAFSLYGLMAGGLMPLADHQILALLVDRYGASTTLYASQLLWGTVACACITFLIGALRVRWGIEVLFVLTPLSVAIAVATILFWGVPSPTPLRPSSSASSMNEGCDQSAADQSAADQSAADQSIAISVAPAKDEKGAASWWASFKESARVISTPRFLVFLGVVLSIGMGRQMCNLLQPHYIERTLLVPGGDIAWGNFSSCAITILCLLAGPFLLASLSTRVMLIIGLLAFCTRLVILLSLKANCGILAVMGVDFFSGISYAFTHMAGVREAAAAAPPGWEATFQALYTCAYVQLPAVFAALVGGHIYYFVGGRALFLYTTVLLLAALAIITTMTVAEAVTSMRRAPLPAAPMDDAK